MSVSRTLRTRRRGCRHAVAALGVVVAAGFATQGPSAHAATRYDGVWTISHGASGQITFNPDGTYTSTCQPIPNFPATNCPSPAGTFGKAYTSVYFKLTGTDGHVMSFRDDATSTSLPTTLNGALIVDRGPNFKCHSFYDSTYAFAKGPLVYTDASGNKGFALGSNQSVGAINAGNYVNLSERSLGYFVKGNC